MNAKADLSGKQAAFMAHYSMQGTFSSHHHACVAKQTNLDVGSRKRQNRQP
jgi:hypothetical protein